jgi:hypothetical protein
MIAPWKTDSRACPGPCIRQREEYVHPPEGRICLKSQRKALAS